MSDYLDKITVGSTTYDIKDSNAYVLPSTGIPSSDLAAGVIPVVPTAYDTTAQALGTASAGTSTSWARGDHVHPLPAASDVGAIAAPASASVDNVLAYNGSAWVADKRTVILSYGSSTWQQFLDAYNANAVIYCRASSNSNPATGVQGRMAFMAFVNLSGTTPTSVEFQYYRSVSSHTVSQQGDQVFIYKLQSSGWTVTTREASTKINVSTGLASSYSDGVLTITNNAALPTGGTTGQALIKSSSTNYAAAWTSLGAVATEDVIPITKGGTGATSSSSALTNLGAQAAAAYISDANITPVYTGNLEIYRYSMDTLNTPYKAGLTDFGRGVIFAYNSDGAGTQLAMTAGGRLMCMRRYYQSAWTDWSKIYNEINIIPISNGGTGATSSSAALTNLGAVAKSGDTMTGNLNLDGSYVNRKLPSSPTLGTTYFVGRIEDASGNGRGGVGYYANSNYGEGTRLYHYRDGISHGVALYIDENGNPSVGIGYPSAWRDGLGAVNRAGDTMTGILTLSKAGDIAVFVENTNKNHKVGIMTGTTGNGGLYDKTNEKYVCYTDPSGNVFYSSGTVNGSLDVNGYITFGPSNSAARRTVPSPMTAGVNYFLFQAWDADGNDRGGMSLYHSSTYGDALWLNHKRTINNTDYHNRVALYVKDDGSPYVGFNSDETKKAWQSALDTHYKAGDTVSFPTSGNNNLYSRFAGDWRTNKSVWFLVPLSRPCDGLTATVSGSIYIYSNDTRTLVDISTTTKASYTCPCGVIVNLQFSTAPAYAIQYRTVDVQPYGFTITFS